MVPDLRKVVTVSHSAIMWALLTIFCVSGTLLCSWYVGRDLNWDSLNYHYYVAYQWSEDRLTKDFLAASIQSYLNPLSYLPFYWMVQAQWPSLLIGSVLAAVHSLNLILIGWFSHLILPRQLRFRAFWIVCSVLAAGISPIFVSEIGTTFNDISTSILVLAAYIICIRSMQICTSDDLRISGNKTGVFGVTADWGLAGILMGMSVGFKMTNAVFAIGILPLFFFSVREKTTFIRRLFLYGVGGVIGFFIINGYWAWRLYSVFGNPFFPFFNAVFQSPDFPAFSFRHYRFVPESFADALLFPINALRAAPDVYTEIIAPDARYLVFFVLVLLLILKRSWKFVRCTDARSTTCLPTSSGLMWWLVATWTFTYALWLYLFGNGRYFMPASLLVGPIIVSVMVHLLNVHRFAIYFMATFIGFQVLQLMEAAQWRWTPAGWSAMWFEVDVPNSLENSGNLYLTPRMQTAMYVAPFLSKNSAFSNIGGQVPLPADGPGGRRVQELMAQYSPNIRSLYPIGSLNQDGKPAEKLYEAYDGIFDRFGLQTDRNDCLVINVKEYPIGANVMEPPSEGIPNHSALLSCRLMKRQRQPLTGTEEQRRIDRVFSQIERTCPHRFEPAGSVTSRAMDLWFRVYANSDVNLLYSPENGKIEYFFVKTGDLIPAGTLAAWESGGAPKLDCSVKSAPPVFRVAEKMSSATSQQ